MKAIKLCVNHPLVRECEVCAEKSFLEQAHKLIGCDLIEVVHPRGLDDPYVLVVDEEGRLKDGHQMNPIASVLYGVLDHGEYIAGDALVAKTALTEEGYDLVWLDGEEIENVRQHINEVLLREIM